MKLSVKRQWFTNKSTMGELLIDGEHFCYTLEPVMRQDTEKPRAIPEGLYVVNIAWSPKHQRLLPTVRCVPGFLGIEIHIGNYPRDTEGCLLVGRNRCGDEVSNSAETFQSLFTLLAEAQARGEEISILYSNETASAERDSMHKIPAGS